MVHDADLSIDPIRSSRAQLLVAADAEGRGIERSLHDGVQQDLVPLSVKLQLLRQVIGSNPAAAERILDEIRDDGQEALAGVRLLAERIYPSLLEAVA